MDQGARYGSEMKLFQAFHVAKSFNEPTRASQDRLNGFQYKGEVCSSIIILRRHLVGSRTFTNRHPQKSDTKNAIQPKIHKRTEELCLTL